MREVFSFFWYWFSSEKSLISFLDIHGKILAFLTNVFDGVFRTAFYVSIEHIEEKHLLIKKIVFSSLLDIEGIADFWKEVLSSVVECAFYVSQGKIREVIFHRNRFFYSFWNLSEKFLVQIEF